MKEGSQNRNNNQNSDNNLKPRTKQTNSDSDLSKKKSSKHVEINEEELKNFDIPGSLNEAEATTKKEVYLCSNCCDKKANKSIPVRHQKNNHGDKNQNDNDSLDQMEKSDNICMRMCNKCLKQHNELQNKLEEKRRLEYNNIQQQKMTNSLNSGFKITYRSSSIYGKPIIEDGMRNDAEEIKDEDSLSSESMK